MFKRTLKVVIALSLLSSHLVLADALSDAVNHANRSIKERARDEYRHPQQTLRFFDVQPDHVRYRNIGASVFVGEGTKPENRHGH